MSATRRLAQYATETTYHELPEAVVTQAKHVVRDSLGCLLGGATLDAGRKVRELLMPMTADGPSTVVGETRHVAPAFAGYINAQLTNLLDFDDTMEAGSVGHPASTIIPSALAIAEQIGASGQQLLTAVVVAYDIYARVALSAKPTFERSKQVRGMATWQVFGAVAAVAHLLNLSPEAAARAFGLAALHAPIPFVGKIYEERPMWALKNNFGWAAMGGVLGAMFADAGFDANHDILEGETGFWAMAGSDRFDSSILTKGLGHRYTILDTSFKPYPSCRFTHSTLDAVDKIVDRTDLRPEEVRSVRVRSASKIRVFADYQPQSYVDAQFSLPYVVALVLLRESPSLKWVTTERWRDPAVLSLAERVHLEVDPDLEKDLARGYMRVQVEITLGDGHVEREAGFYPRGHPSNPLSAHELQQKFLGLAGSAIGDAEALYLSSLIDRLDELPDVTELTALLSLAAS
ncbi:MAG: MmgE/PrpD family protein [Chloroflexota bacterium]|nr:MmgE/PrpD family protein [Chloroflexota bacterium]